MEEDKIPSEKSTKAGIAADCHEEICKRAYELYEARGDGPGDAMQDWLQAEAEILWKMTH